MRKNFNVSLFTIHLLYVQALTYGERLPYAYTNRVGKQSKKWDSIEKTLESSLDCKETKPVNPKGKQPWILIARTAAEAETPILWPPDVKSQLTGKDPDAVKYWRQKEKGWQRMRCLDGITDSTDMNLSKVPERVEDRGRRATVHGVAKSQTWLSDWKTTIFLKEVRLNWKL